MISLKRHIFFGHTKISCFRPQPNWLRAIYSANTSKRTFHTSSPPLVQKKQSFVSEKPIDVTQNQTVCEKHHKFDQRKILLGNANKMIQVLQDGVKGAFIMLFTFASFTSAFFLGVRMAFTGALIAFEFTEDLPAAMKVPFRMTLVVSLVPLFGLVGVGMGAVCGLLFPITLPLYIHYQNQDEKKEQQRQKERAVRGY